MSEQVIMLIHYKLPGKLRTKGAKNTTRIPCVDLHCCHQTFLIRNDVHEMRLIETIAVILPYAGYCQNDTCYKKEVISAVKGKKYSCCEKIIKIACNCGKLMGAIICASRCCNTRKWRMTTGVMWMS